jgi:hypothetical protein
MVMKMILKLSFLIIAIWQHQASYCQPGYSYKEVQYTIYDNGAAIAPPNATNYTVQWKNPRVEWQLAEYKNGKFATAKVKSDDLPIELKITKQSTNEEMQLEIMGELTDISFIPGNYKISRAATYLIKMIPQNAKITNQLWSNYKLQGAGLPLLKKKRYYYYPINSDDVKEDMNNEPGLTIMGFNKSGHMAYKNADEVAPMFNLHKIYCNSSVGKTLYCIGVATKDANKYEEDDEYLLESNNLGLTWQPKFKLQYNTRDLIGYSLAEFVCHNPASPLDTIITYTNSGLVKQRIALDEELCTNPKNLFVPCDKNISAVANKTFEVSNPINVGMYGLINDYFSSIFINKYQGLQIGQMPYQPNVIRATTNGGSDWNTLFTLNTKETYVYLTVRKNRAVLLSYHYTMVSNDFGRTWTFYQNPAFSGGSWNFLWIDDNVLANFTDYYVDYFELDANRP